MGENAAELEILIDDNTKDLLRGWLEAWAASNGMQAAEEQGFSARVAKYILSCEKRGWLRGADSTKQYGELVEEARPEVARWENGRRTLVAFRPSPPQPMHRVG